MIEMVSLIKNTLYEKVKNVGALTDTELYKNMTKDGNVISEDQFNKLLLDLEIQGLIKVSWSTKDNRRIEISNEEPIQDNYANNNDGNDSDNNSSRGGSGGGNANSYTSGNSNASRSNDEDVSYEASFPGFEK